MLSKIEELKLVTRCTLFDDREAFGRLVEEYQSEMRRFFLNMSGGNAALSDDLAQETFLKAYLSIRGFKGLSKFKTWLYRIAYNEYYDWARKRKEELGDSEDATAFRDEPPDNRERTDDARMDVAVALKALNETERSIIILFYMEDKPIKDIVAITSLPEGTGEIPLVKSKKQTCRLPRQELKKQNGL